MEIVFSFGVGSGRLGFVIMICFVLGFVYIDYLRRWFSFEL